MVGYKVVEQLFDSDSLVKGQYYTVRIHFHRAKAWTDLLRTEQGQIIMDIKTALTSHGFKVISYGRKGGYELWLFGQYTLNPIPFLAIAVIGLIGAIVGAYYLTITNGTVERVAKIAESGEIISKAGAVSISGVALAILAVVGLLILRR